MAALLSNYMTGRDSNRGACAQPCRYQYYLMEEKRPGEYFPVFEDGKGTYIMNSRDMCMIDHVDDLIDAGPARTRPGRRRDWLRSPGWRRDARTGGRTSPPG